LVPPLPEEPKLSAPGRLFASAISSLIDFHDHHQRRGVDQHDGLEILCRIVRQLRHQARHDGERRGRHQQRVAVRRRLGDDVGPDHRAAAGAVVHHHRLAPQLAQLQAHGAADDVSAAAGRERHYEAHRPGRIGLRVSLRD
jgi:hypothetical protein